MMIESQKPQKNSSPGMSVGSSSILAIFVILALTTFSMLTLLTANADYKLSQKVATSTVEYYEADGLAEEELSKIDAIVVAEEEPFSALKAAGYDVETKDDGYLVSYVSPINDAKQLYVQLFYSDIAEKTTGNYDILAWQVQPL